MKRYSYLILLILFSLYGCQPIEKNVVTTHAIDSQGAESADLFIRMLQGTVNINSGSMPELIATNYHYNSPFYCPKLEYILEELLLANMLICWPLWLLRAHVLSITDHCP